MPSTVQHIEPGQIGEPIRSDHQPIATGRRPDRDRQIESNDHQSLSAPTSAQAEAGVVWPNVCPTPMLPVLIREGDPEAIVCLRYSKGAKIQLDVDEVATDRISRHREAVNRELIREVDRDRLKDGLPERA